MQEGEGIEIEEQKEENIECEFNPNGPIFDEDREEMSWELTADSNVHEPATMTKSPPL